MTNGGAKTLTEVDDRGAGPQPPPENDESSETEARSSWSPMDWVALAAVTTAGGLLRLQNVARPKSIMFDEVYYAKEACYYTHSSLGACDLEEMPFEVHPPLGKWLISLGIDLFGFDSLGWRIASVVAGTLTIALLYLLARKLLRSTLAAVVTAALLAVDLLHFVQSRIAMLDIFVPLFGVAAVLFAVHDRDHIFARRDTHLRRRAGLRPWRIAAGLSGGAALASKWSGGLVVLTVIVLAVAWELAARREEGGRPVIRMIQDEGPSIFFALVFLPALVYVVTHIGQVDGPVLTAPWSENSWFTNFWNRQIEIFDVHKQLEATHSYESPAWSWPLLKRPVAYFFDDSDNSHILATGAPFAWWSSLLALAFATFRWIRNRNPLGATGVIVGGFAFAYLPWLLLGLLSDRSAVFLFYMLPALPFMYLAVGYMTIQIGRSWEARAALALYAAAAVGLFAFYFPIVANRPLSDEDWHRRLWIFDGAEGCEKPKGEDETTVVTRTAGGRERLRTEVSNTSDTLPPKGWCWI